MRRNPTPLASLLAVLALAGCRKDKPIDADLNREPPAPSTSSTSRPTASASASAPPSVPSASAVEPAPPLKVVATPLKLHRVMVQEPEPSRPWTALDSPRAIHAHALRDVLLVTYQKDSAWVLSGDRLKPLAWWEIRTGMIQVAGRAQLVNVGDGDCTTVRGRYPSDLWVDLFAAFNDGARLNMGGDSLLFRLGEDKDAQRVDKPPSFIEPWTQGVTLLSEGQGFTLSGVAGKRKAPARALDAEGKARVTMAALRALPRGDVMVVGKDSADGKLALERWKPGETASEVLPLGLPAGAFSRLEANERVAYVATAELAVGASPGGGATYKEATQGRLARVEGAVVTPLGLPPGSGVDDMHLAADGTLWMLLTGGSQPGLYRLDSQGELSRAPLPAKFRPEGLFGRNAQVAYVGGVEGETGLLLSTLNRPVLDPTPAPSTSAAGSAPPVASGSASAAPSAAPSGSAAVGDEGVPAPITAGCTTPFVILFAVSKTAPPSYDYPATRDALAGWEDASKYSFVEYSFKGQRTLGARAPSAAAGEALVARLKERINGSAPALVCYAPGRVLRPVSFAGP